MFYTLIKHGFFNQSGRAQSPVVSVSVLRIPDYFILRVNLLIWKCMYTQMAFWMQNCYNYLVISISACDYNRRRWVILDVCLSSSFRRAHLCVLGSLSCSGYWSAGWVKILTLIFVSKTVGMQVFVSINSGLVTFGQYNWFLYGSQILVFLWSNILWVQGKQFDE